MYPAEEWDELLDIRIAKLTFGDGSGQGASFALAFKAGLHLWNDSLDASHTLSQSIETPTGSYWHGIMHRMEGDYSNAKYWFHQVRSHPVYGRLWHAVRSYWEQGGAAAANGIASVRLRSMLERLVEGASWDPYLFVDLVENQVSISRDPAAETVLRRLQRLEMGLLLEYCWEQIGGGTSLEFG
nr:hypothetical protein [Paenibacillus hamazuiensis]